ncbi:hypothetical protein K9L63_01650 [Candidatus Gracilibacteria bacterium]|nr:hypothetical protein [Candidatus Gracilibacteria bacterium]
MKQLHRKYQYYDTPFSWKEKCVFFSEMQEEQESQESPPMDVKDLLDFRYKHVGYLERRLQEAEGTEEGMKVFDEVCGGRDRFQALVEHQIRLSESGSGVEKNFPPRILYGIHVSKHLKTFLSEEQQERIKTLFGAETREARAAARSDSNGESLPQRSILRLSAFYEALSQNAYTPSEKQLLKDIRDVLLRQGITLLTRARLDGVGNVLDSISLNDKLLLLELYRIFPDKKDWVLKNKDIHPKTYFDDHTVQVLLQELADETLQTISSEPDRGELSFFWDTIEDLYEKKGESQKEEIVERVRRVNAARFVAWTEGQTLLLPEEVIQLERLAYGEKKFDPSEFRKYREGPRADLEQSDDAEKTLAKNRKLLGELDQRVLKEYGAEAGEERINKLEISESEKTNLLELRKQWIDEQKKLKERIEGKIEDETDEEKKKVLRTSLRGIETFELGEAETIFDTFFDSGETLFLMRAFSEFEDKRTEFFEALTKTKTDISAERARLVQRIKELKEEIKKRGEDKKAQDTISDALEHVHSRARESSYRYSMGLRKRFEAHSLLAEDFALLMAEEDKKAEDKKKKKNNPEGVEEKKNKKDPLTFMEKSIGERNVEHLSKIRAKIIDVLGKNLETLETKLSQKNFAESEWEIIIQNELKTEAIIKALNENDPQFFENLRALGVLPAELIEGAVFHFRKEIWKVVEDVLEKKASDIDLERRRQFLAHIRRTYIPNRSSAEVEAVMERLADFRERNIDRPNLILEKTHKAVASKSERIARDGFTKILEEQKFPEKLRSVVLEALLDVEGTAIDKVFETFAIPEPLRKPLRRIKRAQESMQKTEQAGADLVRGGGVVGKEVLGEISETDLKQDVFGVLKREYPPKKYDSSSISDIFAKERTSKLDGRPMSHLEEAEEEELRNYVIELIEAQPGTSPEELQELIIEALERQGSLNEEIYDFIVFILEERKLEGTYADENFREEREAVAETLSMHETQSQTREYCSETLVPREFVVRDIVELLRSPGYYDSLTAQYQKDRVDALDGLVGFCEDLSPDEVEEEVTLKVNDEIWDKEGSGSEDNEKKQNLIREVSEAINRRNGVIDSLTRDIWENRRKNGEKVSEYMMGNRTIYTLNRETLTSQEKMKHALQEMERKVSDIRVLLDGKGDFSLQPSKKPKAEMTEEERQNTEKDDADREALRKQIKSVSNAWTSGGIQKEIKSHVEQMEEVFERVLPDANLTEEEKKQKKKLRDEFFEGLRSLEEDIGISFASISKKLEGNEPFCVTDFSKLAHRLSSLRENINISAGPWKKMFEEKLLEHLRMEENIETLEKLEAYEELDEQDEEKENRIEEEIYEKDGMNFARARKNFEAQRTEFNTKYGEYRSVVGKVVRNITRDIRDFTDEDFSDRYQMNKDSARRIIGELQACDVEFDEVWGKFNKCDSSGDPTFWSDFEQTWNASLEDGGDPQKKAEAMGMLTGWQDVVLHVTNVAGSTREFSDWLESYEEEEKNSFLFSQAPKTGLMRKMTRRRKFGVHYISLYQIYDIIKKTIEARNRLLKRKMDRATATLGISVFGNTRVGKEFFRMGENSETERVNEFKDQWHDQPITSLWEAMQRSKDQDEVRAIITLLNDQGALAWDDPILWRALMNLGCTRTFDIPGDLHNLAFGEMRNKVRDAASEIWSYEVFRQWDISMDGNGRKAQDGFDGEFSEYETNDKTARTNVMATMLQRWSRGEVDMQDKSKAATIDPAKYEAFLSFALRDGKMNGQPDQRIYFLVMGIATVNPRNNRPLLSRAAVARLNKTYMGIYPHLDFFVDNESWKLNGRIVPPGTPGAKKDLWNFDDFQSWAKMLGDGGGTFNPTSGETAQNTTNFFYQVVNKSTMAVARAHRVFRNAEKMDHDDFEVAGATWDKREVEMFLQRKSEGTNKGTDDACRRFLEGFDKQMRATYQLIQDRDRDPFYKGKTFWVAEKERILLDIGNRLRVHLTMTQAIFGNYISYESGGRPTVLEYAQLYKPKQSYSPSIKESRDNINRMARLVFAGRRDFSDILEYEGFWHGSTPAQLAGKAEWKRMSERAEEMLSEGTARDFFRQPRYIEEALRRYCEGGKL